VGRWVYYKKNGKTKRVKDYKLSGRQWGKALVTGIEIFRL
jgi:hypothetical protein